MPDSAREIENLLYTYAERIDDGDLDGVGALFAHGRIETVDGGGPETVFAGHEAVRGLYAAIVRLHDDGTPRTHHVTTNAIIEVDEEAGTATSRSRFTVTQATPGLPLQVVVTGRYDDGFHRLDGTWWFLTRRMRMDQVGDLSHHLRG